MSHSEFTYSEGNIITDIYTGKAGLTARNTGKAGLTARNTGKAGLTARNTGKAGLTARNTGKAGLTDRNIGKAGLTDRNTGKEGLTDRDIGNARLTDMNTAGAILTDRSAGSAKPDQAARIHGASSDKPPRQARPAAKASEVIPHILFLICGTAAVGFVLCICVYLVISGIPAIRKIGLVKFLFGTKWQSTAAEPSFGILPFILTSVYGTAGAVLIGVPIGLMSALFLAKAAPKKIAAVIRTTVQLLAGIPSVVYGLVGMIVLVPAVQNTFHLASGATLLTAIIVLAVMILPSIINVSETALEAVPKEYEEASMALGATKMETYFKVSMPAARSGIAASIVLGVGRAIGEAMAIIMVSGNVANMPGLLKSVRFMTTAIASEMSYAPAGSLQREALFSIGLVLFLFIMLINVILNVLIKGRKKA